MRQSLGLGHVHAPFRAIEAVTDGYYRTHCVVSALVMPPSSSSQARPSPSRRPSTACSTTKPWAPSSAAWPGRPTEASWRRRLASLCRKSARWRSTQRTCFSGATGAPALRCTSTLILLLSAAACTLLLAAIVQPVQRLWRIPMACCGCDELALFLLAPLLALYRCLRPL